MSKILWFRRDLRIEDNPLLTCKGEILPIFIFDENILSKLSHDDRRVTFIFEAVLNIKSQLQNIGLDLALFYGKPVEIFSMLESIVTIESVYASGDYDSYAKQRDIEISHFLEFEYLNGTYIFRPDEILKDNSTPYEVFTPYYKKAKAHFNASHMDLSQPSNQNTLSSFDFEHIHTVNESLPISLKTLGFDATPHGIKPYEELLQSFSSKIALYQEKRDFMDEYFTSKLSVHLRFGTLSIRTLLHWMKARKQEGIDTEPFFRQLVFREFYASLLYHFPTLENSNFKYHYNGVVNEKYFALFCNAKTGVPIVDAGLRELIQTGQMHNRVRMICASFFTKDLLLPWQWGEDFFARYLLDYDAASNILSWQWSAGTGVDPQPYFRIFNPYLQAKKFDANAIYIKKWVPELSGLRTKEIHDENFLLQTKIPNYPRPCVKHKEAASKAIESFKEQLTY